MIAKLEHLRCFGQTYFHEDWDLDHPNADDAIDLYLQGACVDERREISQEIGQLLESSLSEAELEEIWQNTWYVEYEPIKDDLTYRQWLEHLLKRLSP